ncbi:MAG: hypothetical protein AAFY71_02225 [Bacteroidota bacterium]
MKQLFFSIFLVPIWLFSQPYSPITYQLHAGDTIWIEARIQAPSLESGGIYFRISSADSFHLSPTTLPANLWIQYQDGNKDWMIYPPEWFAIEEGEKASYSRTAFIPLSTYQIERLQQVPVTSFFYRKMTSKGVLSDTLVLQDKWVFFKAKGKKDRYWSMKSLEIKPQSKKLNGMISFREEGEGALQGRKLLELPKLPMDQIHVEGEFPFWIFIDKKGKVKSVRGAGIMRPGTQAAVLIMSNTLKQLKFGKGKEQKIYVLVLIQAKG